MDAVTFIAMMSFAETVVVVKSVRVVEWIAEPEEIPTPLVLIELVAVGIAVPVPIFQNLTVTVPPLTTNRFHAEIVQAKVTV